MSESQTEGVIDPNDEKVLRGLPPRPGRELDDYRPRPGRDPDPVRQRIRDEEQLRVLVIAHYVFGGLSALCSSFFLMYALIGGLMFFAAGPTAPGEQAVGAFMFPIATALVLAGWAFSACVVYAGRCLGRRQHYRFCFVMACLCCAHVPVGTVLGRYTIAVLARPGVKEMFADAASRSYPAADE